MDLKELINSLYDNEQLTIVIYKTPMNVKPLKGWRGKWYIDRRKFIEKRKSKRKIPKSPLTF
jgi:hypothetical protein